MYANIYDSQKMVKISQYTYQSHFTKRQSKKSEINPKKPKVYVGGEEWL